MLRTSNENLIHDAALDGMGIAFLPTWLMDDDLAAGNLEPVLPQYHRPVGTLDAVYTSRRYLSSTVRSCVDFLADRVAETSR